MTPDSVSNEPRRLSGLLILGILAFPALFVWFALRRGYSSSVRIGAFLYLAVAIGLAVVRAYSDANF